MEINKEILKKKKNWHWPQQQQQQQNVKHFLRRILTPHILDSLVLGKLYVDENLNEIGYN